MMPAIILLSTQNCLLSPFDHAGDQASIRLRSSAITLCSIPHTPCGSQAPLSALGGRALPRPGSEEGKMVARLARQPLHTGNRENSSGTGTDRSRSIEAPQKAPVLLTRQTCVTVTRHSNLLPSASRRHGLVVWSLKWLRFRAIALCRPVIGMPMHGGPTAGETAQCLGSMGFRPSKGGWGAGWGKLSRSLDHRRVLKISRLLLKKSVHVCFSTERLCT